MTVKRALWQPLPASPFRSRTARLIVALVVSLLIHLAVSGWLHLPTSDAPVQRTLTARLLLSPPTKEAAASGPTALPPAVAHPTPPKPTLKPVPRHEEGPRAQSAPPLQSSEAPAAPVQPAPTAVQTTADPGLPKPPESPAPYQDATPASTSAAIPGSTPDVQGASLAPPASSQAAPGGTSALPSQPAVPSVPAEPAPDSATPLYATAPQYADLAYHVVATDQGSEPPTVLRGTGTVHWSLANGHYDAGLTAGVSILFASATVLDAQSRGSVTEHGLIPNEYGEKRIGRPQSSVTFDRGGSTDGGGQLVFSEAAPAKPFVAGTQDRVSVLLQLIAVLRTNPKLTQAGAHLSIPVASIKGAPDLYHFSVTGEEPVDTSLGRVRTVHLQRELSPQSHDRGIELWLMPDHQLLPAMVRFIEGRKVIDMTLAGERAPVPAANTGPAGGSDATRSSPETE